MKEKIEQLIEELEQRHRHFCELYKTFDANKYWEGWGEEAELIAEKLRQITMEWEQLPYDKQGDDGDLLPV